MNATLGIDIGTYESKGVLVPKKYASVGATPLTYRVQKGKQQLDIELK